VVTVGAINRFGNIWDYSSRGNKMDIVAPSGNTGGNGDVVTIDRMGTLGYNAGANPNYAFNFGGTSAAAPQVSGVATLMLSVNPILTETQVRTILQQTATDMGPSGFDNTFGFGRLNAQAAVQAALPTISGPSLVCTTNSTFNLSNLPTGATVTWSRSSNLTLVSSSSSSVTVKAVNSNVGGNGWVKATITGDCDSFEVQEYILVGKANVDNVSFSNGIGEQGYFCSSHYGNTYNLFPTTSGGTHQIRLKKYPNLNIVYQLSQNFIGNQGTLNYTPSPGFYLFEVRRTNACGQSGWFGYEVEFVDCSLGGGGGGGEHEFFVYPNPSSENLNIQKTKNQYIQSNYTYTYKFFDFNSNLIFQGSLINGTATINTSHLQKGRYILKIYGTKEEEETHHIMVK
jgi:hypothetical protein